jgi:gliding motility-associated-like protein
MRARYSLILLLLVSTFELYAQLNATQARHETDAQTSTTLTLSGNLAANYTCTGGCLANWSVTIGGVPATVTAVSGAIGSSLVVVSFTPAVGIGQAVVVNHTNDGIVNNIVNLVSQNNRAIICSDFAWESTNTPTPPCAPVDPITKIAFSVKRGARNSSAWASTTLRVRAHWVSNGAVPFNDLIAYESNNAGIATPNTYYIAGDAASSAYIYPANDPVCGYTATFRVLINGTTSCAFTNPNQQVPYASHNNDDTGVGADVILQPSVVGSDLVCLGSNVNMTFRDNTDLNCNPTTPPVPTNDAIRWVRVVYGSTDLGGGNTAADNIPNIQVAGTPVTDANGNLLFPGGYIPATTPFGVPDAFGVVTVTAPVTTARGLLDLITTSSPLGQVVGQRFWVRLDYWNACNPYDGAGDALNLRRSVENEIEIITKPAALTTTGASVCFDNTNNIAGINFTATNGLPGRTAVNWYRNLAAVSTATRMTNPNGGNSLTFPASSYGSQGGIGGNFTTNNANGRYMSVWATQVIGATNSCESDPVEIVIVQQPRIDIGADIPNTPAGDTEVCNGPPGTIETYTTNAPNTKTIAATTSTNGAIINLPTENIWSVNAFAATVSLTPGTGNSTNVTFNISPQPNPSDPGEVRVRRGYVTTTNIPIVSPLPAPFTLPTYNINPQACLNANRPLAVTVFGQSDGGTISGTTTICNGASTGNMTVTGHRGAVLQWERSFNAGAFIAIAATGGLTTFNEVPPNGPGTYKYRVLVQNQNATGPCASATTIVANQNTITVNPVPGKPAITQGAGSDGLAICLGDQTVLQSDNPGAIAGVTYRWFKAPDMVTPVQTGASNTLTLTTVAQSGDYLVQIIGPAPSNCPSTVSDPVTVTISGLPSATVSGGGAACDGNPAPDIIWTFSGGTSYDFTIDRPAPDADIVVVNHALSTYTLSGQTTAGNYQLSALSNSVTGCVGTSLGGSRAVTSAGGAPAFDAARVLTPTETCVNGASTTDPSLAFSLTAVSASTNGFILNYTINGSTNRTKNFNTDANGTPTAAITFSDTELNAVGTHTIRLVSIQSPAGCLGLFNENISFIVRPLPVISTQPVDAEVCVGGNTSYTVAASTAGATSTNIQWQVSTTGSGGPWTDLVNGTSGGVTTGGATSTTLTLSGVTLAMNTNRYRAVVTGVFPTTFSCPVISTDRLLTVRPYANITVQPPTRVLCSGESTTFGVTANVTAPSTITGYQWQISTAGAGGPYINLTNVAPYSNVTTATMTITGATTALSGNHYRVMITTTGACAQPSDPGPLTVNPLPTSNAISPIVCEDINHIVGNPSIGQGEATNVDLSQFSAALADIPGAPVEVPAGFEVLYFQDLAHTSQITTPTTISPGEQIFTRVRNIATGCFTDRTITFTVRPQPAPTSFTDQVCEDNPPGSLVASGIDLTSYEAIVTGGAGNRDVEWYTDAALTALIPAGTLPNQEENFSISATTTLFAKIIDTTPGTPGCNSVAELELEYQPRPNPNTIRDGAGVAVGATYTVCASNNLVFLQIDPTINPGATYSWNVPTPPPLTTDPGYFELLTGTNGFFIILRFPSLIPNPGLPISVTETLGTAGCAGTTINTSVIVEGSPSAPVITGPATVCANSPVIYSVPFVSGDTYSWTVPPGATITSFPITNTINVQMSTFSGNVTVTVANSTGCVAPPSTPLAVTVVTKPSMTSPPTNILCSGQAPDDVHTLAATLGGTTYRWEIISISGFVSGANVGDTDGSVLGSNTPGAANIDSRTLTNTSGVDAAVIYRVIPVSPPTAGVYCEGNQQNVTITIRPEPSLLLTPKTVCSDEPANYEIQLATVGLPVGTQFSWAAPVMSDGSTQGTSGVNVPAGASGTVHINDAFLNTSAGPITATYTIAAVSGAGCSSNQPVANRQVIITINPKPLVSITLDKAVCSDEALALILNTEPGSTAAGVYNIVSQTVAGLLIPDAGNADVPQGNVAANYLAGDKFTNTSGGPLLVTYLVNARGTAGLGACQGPDQLITVTINPGPATNPVTDEVCSDVAGGDTFVEDLTSLQSLVNSDGSLIFEWYTDAAATIPIGTPTAYPLQDGVPVYVKVHNGAGTCAKIQAIEYVVNPTPAVTASITSNYNGVNVRCIGSADGTITADPATLGQPNYTYSIDGSNFFTGRIFNGLAAAGNPYVITVRDARGCTATSAPLNLIAPAALTATPTITSNFNGQHIECPGGSNGEVTVAPTGGTGTKTFSILELPGNISGATTGVFSGLTAGTYTFVVRDVNNCQFTTASVTLVDPPAIVATAVLTTPVSCNGQADGVITVTASGGTVVGPTYTYTISPGGTSNTTGVFGGLAANTYTVNVEDDNGCTKASNSVSVTQPSVLTAFASVTSNYNGAKISCPGANDAVITATANGGNGGFTYVLVEDPLNTTGNATGIYTGVGPGSYTVSVTDALSCNVVTVPVNITEPTPLNASGVISSVISCNGGSDGEIRISSTGGTGAYTFAMITPAGPSNATGIFSGLAQGTYDFEVRDLNNCTDVVQVILAQPTAITASALVETPYNNGSQISCNGASDGVITVTASGGTGALTYVFDQFPANLTGASTGVFTGVPAGTGYTFSVRDSKSCTAPVTVPVDVVQPLVITASAAVTSNYNGQHITCPTATDGVITVTASGGTGALTYRLDQAPLNVTGAASGVFTGVGVGSYTVTVRDANSCFMVTTQVTVTPPPAVTASAAVTSNYSGRQISCNGASDGILTVTAGGGVAPYTYVLNEIPGNVTGAATGVFTGLPAGTYTVNVRDLNNCPVVTLPVTMSEPTPVAGTSNVTSNYNGQQIRCVGSSDGIIRVTGSGGTAPYTFISIEVPGNVTGASTGIFTGLPAGSYTFAVRDANNCTFVTPAVVISPPTSLNASALVTSNYHGSQISCNGAEDGTVTVTASGGTGVLHYQFIEDPSNTTGASSGIFTGIGAGGPYTFLVTDANTCTATTTGVNISEPDPIAASAAITSSHNGQHISCPTSTDGVITVTATGGTGVYTYRLDQSPLNTTGNSTGVYSNVGAGTYTVTVRDENSCFIVTTSVTVVPPPAVTASAAVTSNYNGQQISCNGLSDGILTVTAGGGVGSYTYLLDQVPANVTGAATGVFTGLPAGTYTVTVRDGNNCPVTTPSVTITQPALLGATAAVTSNYNGQQISCNGASDGTITITVSGGTGPFAYTSVEVPGNITGASSGIFTGLPAGNYTFDVTDINTCSTTTAQVTISQPAQLAATLAVTSTYNGRDVSCSGASDGELTVTVTTPGTGASTFTIDQLPLNASGRFSGLFTGVPPGNYTVTVRDANNCSIVTNAVTIDPTPAILATAAVTKNVNCFAEANGIITVTAAGGTGSLEYLLIQDASNLTGQFSGVFTGLRAGNYTVRVTDDNTCFVTTAQVTVTQPANLEITIAKISPYNGFDLSCAGASDGEIRVTSTTGGTGPYTYALDGFPGNTTGQNSGIFTGLSAGLYTITVTDANTGDPFGACTRQSIPVFLNDPVPLGVNLIGFSKQICIGDDPTAITQIANPVGGIGIYTYQWQDSIVGGVFTDIAGANSATFDPPVISQTTYYRRLLSSGSCATIPSDPVTITVNPLPEIDNITAPLFVCENQAMIVFYDFAPGQSPFYVSYTQETIDQSGTVVATKVVTDEISGDSKPVIQSPFTEDVRITVTGLRDFNGCVANPGLFPAPVYVEVLKTSAAFTATAATLCSGSPFDVQWTANPEVEYTFKWPEGPDAIFGPGLTGAQSDSRILHSQNPTGTQTLPIILTATNTLHLSNPAAPDCGIATHLENITIFPTIIPNIVVPIDSVCSGTPISITNSTQGGTVHSWTVTDAGGAVLPAPLTRTGPVHSQEVFVIHNQTTDNPAQYDIAYHIENSAANGSCSRDTTVTVTVYREGIARIGSPKDPAVAIPLWTAPSDDITFENATSPIDAAEFEYTWIFSNNNPSTPADTVVSAAASEMYTFLNPGAGKRAILIVVNRDALIAGLPNGCETRDEFIFTINVPPLTALFVATPLAACLPTVIDVTNQSTGEFTSEWRVVNQTNNEIYFSQEFEPDFPITAPGRYTITLTVKNPFDATSEESAPPVDVDVFANPVAAFITSPLEKVFVPDQEMRTDNGSASPFDPLTSTRFPIEYRWYFGDGSDTVRTNPALHPNPVYGDDGHSPTHKYDTEGSYQIALIAINDHGGGVECRDTAFQMIQARASGTSKVPNAFTPNPGGPSGGIVNEDGTTINDVFLPITKGVKEFQMQIFDRWGNLIFESRQQNRGWDGYDRNGNLVPAGVYVYKLVLRMANDQRTTQVGDVTLLR